MALETIPLVGGKVDRSQISSLTFNRRLLGHRRIEPGPLRVLWCRLLRRPRPEAVKVPCISMGPHISYTVNGGDGPRHITLCWSCDDDAAELAKWLERRTNKFEPHVREIR